MSIVSVHGPNTFGSKAIVANAAVKATTPGTNGMVWVFEAKDKTRVAADYDWTFGANSSPATATDNKGPITVTYSVAGAKTVTLTVAAGAGPPAGGAYVVTVNAAAGALRMMDRPDGEEVDLDVDPSETAEAEIDFADFEEVPEIETGVAYDPAAHNVADVVEYAEDHPDQVSDLIQLEEEGKNRSTLLEHLYEMNE